MDPEAPQPSASERAPSQDAKQLLELASGVGLTEDIALQLLTRRDLPGEVIEAVAKNPSMRTQRKVQLAIASHPKTPRHVSLPLARHLYTFELVKIALLPTVPADVKVGIDETIISRLEQISAGERLTLAKQASGRVAGALLLDAEQRVVQAALQNPKMTEALIITALNQKKIPPHSVLAICDSQKWSLRPDVQLALLRNQHTPLAHAIQFAAKFPEHVVRQVLSRSSMNAQIKLYLLNAFN